MNCLSNLIGIKTCNVNSGTSPYYIEDIGITVTEANQYINNNYPSGQEFIEEKIALSTQLVKDLIINHFSSSIITKSLIDGAVVGLYQNNLNMLAGSANTLGGLTIKLDNSNNYLKCGISSISLQVDYDGIVEVGIYNLITGELLDTVEVTCEANKISTKYVNKDYSADGRNLDLAILYDTTDISSNTTKISNDCGSCTGYTHRNYYISSQGVYMDSSSTKIRSSLTTSTHTYGMSVTYGIACSFDNWLCQMGNLMALPILYKTGMEIMEYATLYSNRQTSTINIDFERNKERLLAYTSKYNEAMQATVDKIALPKHNRCFICNTQVKTAIVLP